MTLLQQMALESVAELGRESTDGTAETMDLGVRLEVTGEHGRHGTAVRADWTTDWPRVEMVAKVQFKMVSILCDKRTRGSGTFEDALRANVSTHVIVEQFLSTTSDTKSAN